jgi:hypothetical protein
VVSADVKEVLQPIARMLEGDGYDFRVEVGGDGVIAVAVEATPDACADCLVPPQVMEGIVRATLGEEQLAADGHRITISYPEGSAAGEGGGGHH